MLPDWALNQRVSWHDGELSLARAPAAQAPARVS